MKIDILPTPKRVIPGSGSFSIPIDPQAVRPAVAAGDAQARAAARLLAEKLGARVITGRAAGQAPIRLERVEELDFASDLRDDRRTEAYRLEVTRDGVLLTALTTEGLLRGVATLLQMVAREGDRLRIPCAVVEDWPDFRYRCAADWLVNVECNRWALDWGDGRAAFLERVKRKLNFCFDHKINLVWFDGFGWDTARFPGYARLMRECTRAARRLGIRLEFGGYGGGYGTAYQSGEIYRCGYFGKVFRNRRSYPEGKTYACRGWPREEGKSRFYGTCLSNAALREAKIEEMKRFVREVNPGLLYIHDIDAGAWSQSEITWKQRCGACRKRWPNDELAAPDGQAGACAEWFRQVRRELSALPDVGGYSPARDLIVAFASPLYAHYQETKPDHVWELEKHYFDSLSRAIGPERGIQFVLREMFHDDRGRKKIADLRRLLDQNGNGHGIHVAAFGGGDNYISDDLTNVAGAMAHLYDGAEAVYLSNGGLHQAPIQMLNAAFLWSGSAGGYRETPGNEGDARALFERIGAAEHRPPELLAPGGYVERLCVRVWGRTAGRLMYRALQARHDGQPPVSHVWWSITQTLGQLKRDDDTLPLLNNFLDRRQACVKALKLARKAAAVSDHEDIGWFIQCLAVGEQFAEAMHWLFRVKAGETKADARLKKVLAELKAHIQAHFSGKQTDKLGGEPGCWPETIAEIERLAEGYVQRPGNHGVLDDFIYKWQVSRVLPSAGRLDKLDYPTDPSDLELKPRAFPSAFCDVHEDLAQPVPKDALVFFVGRFRCPTAGSVEVRIGYDGPLKVWVDGAQVFHDPAGTNPARVDESAISWGASRGRHALTIALGSNGGKACGIYARLRFLRAEPPSGRGVKT